jgi:hypothetical protein
MQFACSRLERGVVSMGQTDLHWRRALARVAKGGAKMVDKSIPAEVEVVSCAVCQKEIPKSVALSSEDQDYILHFCGLDCYEEWSADQTAVKMQEAGEG